MGFTAPRRIDAARSTCWADGSSGLGMLMGRGGASAGAVAVSTSSGTARYTAPGRSVWANLNAFRTISGTAPAVRIMSAHFVTGENMDTRSTLWWDSL